MKLISSLLAHCGCHRSSTLPSARTRGVSVWSLYIDFFCFSTRRCFFLVYSGLESNQETGLFSLTYYYYHLYSSSSSFRPSASRTYGVFGLETLRESDTVRTPFPWTLFSAWCTTMCISFQRFRKTLWSLFPFWHQPSFWIFWLFLQRRVSCWARTIWWT